MSKETIPNPNGANATQSDPREQICWDLYLKSILDGRENAYASAIEAGYSESSAKNITMRDWFKDRLRRLTRKDMLSKAEKLLDKTLTLEAVNEEGKTDTNLLRIQTDVAKHITNTLGKEAYSTRQEVTGKDGEQIQGNTIILKDFNATDSK